MRTPSGGIRKRTSDAKECAKKVLLEIFAKIIPTDLLVHEYKQ